MVNDEHLTNIKNNFSHFETSGKKQGDLALISNDNSEKKLEENKQKSSQSYGEKKPVENDSLFEVINIWSRNCSNFLTNLLSNDSLVNKNAGFNLITSCYGSRRAKTVDKRLTVKDQLTNFVPDDGVSYIAFITNDPSLKTGFSYEIIPQSMDTYVVRKDVQIALHLCDKKPNTSSLGSAIVIRYSMIRAFVMGFGFGLEASLLSDFVLISICCRLMKNFDRMTQNTQSNEPVEESPSASPTSINRLISDTSVTRYLNQSETTNSRILNKSFASFKFNEYNGSFQPSSMKMNLSNTTSNSEDSSKSKTVIMPNITLPSTENSSAVVSPRTNIFFASLNPSTSENQNSQQRITADYLHTALTRRLSSIGSHISRLTIREVPSNNSPPLESFFPSTASTPRNESIALTTDIMESILLNTISSTHDDIQRKINKQAQESGTSLGLVVVDDESCVVGIAAVGNISVIFAEQRDNKNSKYKNQKLLKDDSYIVSFEFGNKHSPYFETELQRVQNAGSTIFRVLNGRTIASLTSQIKKSSLKKETTLFQLKCTTPNFIYDTPMVHYPNGLELPVTRGLGFLSAIPYGLSPVPDIATIEFASEQQSFIIMASFQVWIVFESSKLITEYFTSWIEQGQHTVQTAVERLRDETVQFWKRTREDDPGDIFIGVMFLPFAF